MVKVVAIMGSPRKTGNTYKVTKMLEERMKTLGDVEFEYVFLKDVNLGICKGCRLCMDKSEELCPHKDDRALLEQKMLAADGLIFASPTYVANVTGLMKNFIDRFAYVCHRPRFFKNALLLTTSGGGGAGFMLMGLGISANTWGINVVDKLSVVAHEHGDRGAEKERAAHETAKTKKINSAAKKFYGSLRAGPPKPGLMAMAQFLLTKDAHLKDDPASLDYRHWKEHGWHEKSAYYYYGPEPGIIKKCLIVALSKVLGLAAR